MEACAVQWKNILQVIKCKFNIKINHVSIQTHYIIGNLFSSAIYHNFNISTQRQHSACKYSEYSFQMCVRRDSAITTTCIFTLQLSVADLCRIFERWFSFWFNVQNCWLKWLGSLHTWLSTQINIKLFGQQRHMSAVCQISSLESFDHVMNTFSAWIC